MSQRRANFTFAAFQATGREVADLREESPDHSDRSLYPKPVPARIYGGDDTLLYITPNDSTDPIYAGRGPWVVEIGNWCEIGELEKVEAELYGFYLHECVDDDVQDYLLDIAPDSSYMDKADHESEEWLAALPASFCAFHGLTSATAALNASATPDQQRWMERYALRWAAAVEGDEEAARKLAEDAGRSA